MANLKFTIHPLFFVFGLYFAFIGKVFSFIVFTLVAIMHELGHYFASVKCGYKLNKITLLPFGAIIKGDILDLKYIDECKIALAGPLINALTALFFTALWWFVPDLYAYTDVVVLASLSLAVINLLPCYPLDGGRFLYATLAIIIGRKKAKLIVKFLGLFFSLLLFALFIISIFNKLNLSILFFSVFMLIGVFGGSSENRYVKAYSYLTYSLPKRPLIKKQIVVSDKSSVKDLFLFIDNNYYYEIKVLTSNNSFFILEGEKLFNLLTTENIYTQLKDIKV